MSSRVVTRDEEDADVDDVDVVVVDDFDVGFTFNLGDIVWLLLPVNVKIQ